MKLMSSSDEQKAREKKMIKSILKSIIERFENEREKFSLFVSHTRKESEEDENCEIIKVRFKDKVILNNQDRAICGIDDGIVQSLKKQLYEGVYKSFDSHCSKCSSDDLENFTTDAMRKMLPMPINEYVIISFIDKSHNKKQLLKMIGIDESCTDIKVFSMPKIDGVGNCMFVIPATELPCLMIQSEAKNYMGSYCYKQYDSSGVWIWYLTEEKSIDSSMVINDVEDAQRRLCFFDIVADVKMLWNINPKVIKFEI